MAATKARQMDKPFLALVLVLSFSGFAIFISAAMGLVARGGANVSSVIINQSGALVLGLVLMLIIALLLPYWYWKKAAAALFLVAIVLCLLLFVPGLGMEHSGAVRWLSLGPVTLQPAEFLKAAFIIYCAAWLAGVQKKIHLRAYGLIPLILLFAVTGGLLLLQPDTNSFVFIVLAGVAMFFVAGAKLRDVATLLISGILGFIALVQARPYVLDRIVTLFQQDIDLTGSSYQIQQSLIAVGSGEIFGRGYGQGIQKFTHLPEAIGDSIFPVAAEEFGFIGSLTLITLFILLLFRGLQIAAGSSEVFPRLLVVGIVIMIIVQAFTNIAGMIEVFPLSGTPLPYISHGGTALVTVLVMSGMVLNISRYSRLGEKSKPLLKR